MPPPCLQCHPAHASTPAHHGHEGAANRKDNNMGHNNVRNNASLLLPLPSLLPLSSSLPATLVDGAIALFVAIAVPGPTPLSPLLLPLPVIPIALATLAITLFIACHPHCQNNCPCYPCHCPHLVAVTIALPALAIALFVARHPCRCCHCPL